MNRDFDTKESSRAERDASEQAFFESRVWSSAISKTQLGIDSLRPRLSRVLLGQIVAELPNLVRDVEHELEACKHRLRSLGHPRSSIDEQRSYLLNASSRFVYFVRDSITGVYTDSFFGSSESKEGYDRRLRAVAQNELLEFAETMRVRGHAQEIVGTDPEEPECERGPSETGPQRISKEKYLTSVGFRMRRNRGCELPGLFNPAIVGDLFFDQARPWKGILQGTEGKLVAAAKTTVSLIVENICDAVTGVGILRYIIRPNMEPVIAELHAKVEEVLKPHTRGHPITFNHYFTENLQKKRQAASRARMAAKMREFFWH